MLQLAPQKVLGFYGFPLLTMGLASAALVRSDPDDRFRWILGIMTLAALIGLAVWEMRVTAAASMVAAPLFAASLAILWPALAPGRSLHPVGARRVTRKPRSRWALRRGR